MDFLLDKSKICRTAPGTFEANILRSIAVPYQEIVTSGGQYPLPTHPIASAPRGRAIVIRLEGLSAVPSFAKELPSLTVTDP